MDNTNEKRKSTASMVLGILSMICWLFPLAGFPISICGIVLSAKHNRWGCLALSIIGAVLTLISSISGAVAGYNGTLFK